MKRGQTVGRKKPRATLEKGRTEPSLGRQKQLVDPHPQRQARDKFRGYAYQAYQTILAWLRCRLHEEILCEFGEDIAIVKRDAAGEVSKAELDQVKHQKGKLTLNSETAAKAVNSLLLHSRENPSVSLLLRVCTIAERGQERGINWRYADSGLDLWDRIRDDPTAPEDAIKILRTFLLEHEKLSTGSRNFINDASNSEFKSELLGRIFWDTGQQSYTEVQAEINRLLATMPRPVIDLDEAEAIVNRLWRHVTDRMAAASSSPLTKQDLEELLKRETLAQVDRRTFREMATNISDLARAARIESVLNPLITKVAESGAAPLSVTSEVLTWRTPPPLPDMCSLRARVVEDLRSQRNSRDVLWIHGWTGAGKSTVANLLVRAIAEPVLWCSLRNLQNFSLAAALERLIKVLSQLEDAKCVLVYDDVSAEDLNTSSNELIRRTVDLIRSKHWKLVITSQQQAPSRLRAELAASLCEFVVPGLEEAEIKELLQSAGLSKEPNVSTWAGYIAGMTAGHPLLACARIIQARQTGWKLSAQQLLSEPRSVEQVKAEARKSLAASIAFDDARELARRLSVVMGVFRRGFAQRLGLAPPRLSEPGRAFDSLVGPWIERIAEDRFAISPLLVGYAQAEFGDDVLPKYFGIAALAWLGERTLTPIQLVHAAMTALAGGNEELLIRLSVCLAREDAENLTRFAKHIAWFSHLSVVDDASTSKFSVPSKFIFRQAQMRVAALNSDWDIYIKVDALVTKLLEQEGSEAFADDLRLCHFVFTSLHLGSPIPFPERLARALAVVRMDLDGSITKRLSISRRPRYPLGAVAMAASVSAKTPADLECWVETLRRQGSDVSRLIFKSFDAYTDSYSLLLGHVWQNTSRATTPDWDVCLKAFDATRKFGESGGNASLVAASVRASMIVLDEFLGNSAAAIDLASQTRRNGFDHPLIDLAEAMVCYRAGDDACTLRCVERVEKNDPHRQLIVERVFALASALRAGSRIKGQKSELISRLKWIAKRGLEISRYPRKEAFGCLARTAFTAELGWLAHEEGDYRTAVEEFSKAVQGLGSFPDQTDRFFRSLRLRVGHVIAWLSQGACENGELATPFAGLIANFDEPVDELLAKPGAPQPMLWALLSEYAALVGETNNSRRFIRRVRTLDGHQFYLAALQSAEALFLSNLLDGTLQAGMHAGIEYARILSLGVAVLRDREPDSLVAMEAISLDRLFEQNTSVVIEKCHENFPTFALAPLFMGACARKDIPQPNFADWRRQISAAFGANQRFSEAFELLQTGFRAVLDEEEEAVRIVRHLTGNPTELHEHLRILPLVMSCALNAPDLRQLLTFQVSILLDHARRLRGTWAAVYCRMVATRWRIIAETQPFRFVAPRIMPDAIIRASSTRLFGLPHCARLLLVAAQAVGVRWSRDTLERLNLMSSRLSG